jgi:hypothetical protein
MAAGWLILLLQLMVIRGGAQLFSENLFADSKGSPILDTIDADLMEDMEMSESLQTEHQIKLRDFYR